MTRTFAGAFEISMDPVNSLNPSKNYATTKEQVTRLRIAVNGFVRKNIPGSRQPKKTYGQSSHQASICPLGLENPWTYGQKGKARDCICDSPCDLFVSVVSFYRQPPVW